MREVVTVVKSTDPCAAELRGVFRAIKVLHRAVEAAPLASAGRRRQIEDMAREALGMLDAIAEDNRRGS